ncbi:MAG: class I SAM-dependent methyltransferase [Chloroflexi bacterium]|nr:class I SAM-dependent methyltransferase [Chloroflexota bacterium]
MTKDADDRRQMFAARYASGETPWDSGITPPEIIQILSELPPGAALDMGCGTGTVLRDLLAKGWQGDGIDFVPAAIELAAKKLAGFPTETWRVFCHDVTRLPELTDLREPYQLIIDIGCGHGLHGAAAEDYARGLSELLAVGGVFMLYAAQPRPESAMGWRPDFAKRLFCPPLRIVWRQDGDDAKLGAKSS